MGPLSMNGKIKVIALVGFGRSGTTLIDNILGQNHNFFSAGEIRHIWERGLCQHQLCGCGKKLPDCQFWHSVLEKALGKNYQAYAENLKQLASEVDKPKHILKIMTKTERSAFGEKKAKYLEYLERLFIAMSEVLGGDVTILDSSKTPSHVLLLSELAILDLKIVHVVRDPRAVAFSWARSKVRPEIKDKVEEMPKYSYIKSGIWWFGANLVSEIVSKKVENSYLLKYENFVENPEKEIGRLLERFFEENSIAFTSYNSINLESNHTVAGNPSRFKTGPIDIRPDRKWIENMKVLHKTIIWMIDFILMIRYGYK